MSPAIFDFKGTSVQVFDKDGDSWFVAADVCRVLGLGNPSLAVNGNKRSGHVGLDEDEKGITIRNTLGGKQNILCVNESGLYALIFKSRKPEARAFRKWVTSEVIPAIRKSGRYETGTGSAANEAAAVAWVLGQIARTIPWAKALELILPLHAYGSLAANGLPRTGFRRPAFVAAPHRTAAATDFHEHAVLVKLLARQQELPFREGGIRE